MTKKWCIFPYPDHLNGCPQYNKSSLCPPKIDTFTLSLEKYAHFYLFYAKFNLQTYIEKMRVLHPEWSERQLRNLIYWQNSVKKILKDYILDYDYKRFDSLLLGCGSGFDSAPSMEAVGINVLATLRKNHISYEVKPKTFVRLVCLLCTNQKIKKKQKQMTLL